MISFCVEETPGGFTWSYSSLLGHLLLKAEALYGERDKSYTILGVEMRLSRLDVSPRIWYPGNCKHIVIQITSICEGHFGESVYQLAHEIIHCLSPSGGENANLLEEGLAVHFAMQCAAEYEYYPNPSKPYQEALGLVSPIIDRDDDFIKKLRKREASLFRITKENLSEVVPSISPEIAESLIKKF